MFFDSDKVADEIIYPDNSIVNIWCNESSLSDAKSGKGQVLKLGFVVVESNGEVNISEYLNIFHETKTTERIGQQRLKSYCSAINKPQLAHNSDLLKTQCRAKLGIEVYEGRKRNIIKEFLPPERTHIGNVQQQPAIQSSPSSSASMIPPATTADLPEVRPASQSLNDVPF